MQFKPPQSGTAHLVTREGGYALRIGVARSFRQRLFGLMFSKYLDADAGLLLRSCSSVHCMFMRYPIDLVYLDDKFRVLACVERLPPWRASVGPRGTRHTLELAAGSVERMGIAQGDFLDGALTLPPAAALPARRHEAGASLVEFAVVGPLITLIGLALVQYGQLFFAKSQVNHASFMAARGGSTGNAQLKTALDAYAKALVPMYGGGKTPEQIGISLAKAKADVEVNSRIEILNPTKESFKDFHSPELAKKLGLGNTRVIQNANQAFAEQKVGQASGQTIQEANLLKLRITHGYKMSVPIVSNIYKAYLRWLDPKDDEFHTRLVEEGRLPIVSNVTVEMQSNPIEDQNASIPGAGNGGKPTDPGAAPEPVNPPPNCNLYGNCSGPTTPGGGGSGTDGSGDGGYCPAPVRTELSTDTLFDFGSAVLKPEGKQTLDALIKDARDKKLESVDITGYTDPIGSATANQKLSEDRARAVANYLKSNNFPSVQMNVQGMGASNLKVQESACPDPAKKVACLAPNRRVEIALNLKKAS